MFDEFWNFWNIWSMASIAVFVGFFLIGLIFFKVRLKKFKWITPYHVWIVGIVFSTTFMLAPIYLSMGEGVLLISLQHAIRLFAVDGGVSDILAMLEEVNAPEFTRLVYTVIGNLQFFLAAIVTFGFILSFFKNITTNLRYRVSIRKHVHIFSELNERTLALAKSIVQSSANNEDEKPPLIIFADIIDRSEENQLDLIDGAEELGAIFFRKDLASVKLVKREHSIYLVSDDESEKIRHAQALISRYGADEEKKLYIFSDSEECKSYMDSFSNEAKNNIKMQIECINDIRFLVYNYLDEHGIELFRNAHPVGKNKEISVAVVGLGKYGIEMVKALLWYCQMPGYKICVSVFDKDEKAEDKIQAMFPGMELDKDFDHDGDMKYHLNVFSGVEVGTETFKTKFLKLLPDINHVFVMLGEDSENLSASIAIRRYLEQNGCSHAHISTVIYNTALCENINMRRQSAKPSRIETLNIHAFGDIERFYSRGTVINSELVREGLAVHQSWSIEPKEFDNTYYMDDYNFYSSVAKALHYRLRAKILSRNNSDYPYEDVFPAVFESDGSDERSMRYFLQNTMTAEEAKVFRKKYTDKLAEMPSIDAKSRIGDLVGKRTEKGKIPGEKNVEDILIAVGKNAADIDHIRWVAYMRTEGFVYKEAKSIEFRTHNKLVSTDELSLEDCINDI